MTPCDSIFSVVIFFIDLIVYNQMLQLLVFNIPLAVESLDICSVVAF